MVEPVWLQRHVIVSQAGLAHTVKMVCFATPSRSHHVLLILYTCVHICTYIAAVHD